ncbi:diacylglycerol/lipid kinase family protein [Streptomyces sp. NPDC056987]|uniref:diacylglycerol/lipid kinase family protein n=1 Tax=Streptomyces sp. NPDC056987 TaxID=3345988 RepID=UPI00362C0979
MTLSTAPPPRHAVVIANPTAGTIDDALLDSLLTLFARASTQVTLHRTARIGDATAAARAACAGRRDLAVDLVVAVGGDGTVHEVIEGMTGTPPHRPGGAPALAVVPAGTGNSGYLMLWGERPWRESLHAILTGSAQDAVPRPLDLARVAETGAKVFLGACSGVIADALRVAGSIPLSGRARYARAFAESAAAFTPYPGRVTVDGTVLHEGPTVLANVGGGRFRGGQYQVLPRSELDDGLLDVCVVDGSVAPSLVPELTRHGDHLGSPGIFYGRGSRIVVERLDGAPLCFEHDGELQPPTLRRVTLEVLPAALTVWGPPTARLSTSGSRAGTGPDATETA